MLQKVTGPQPLLRRRNASNLPLGRKFSAGITRFMIPNRVLRLNVDLAFLKSDQPLKEKNRWLHERLLEKQKTGSIRYYQESVCLLDE